MRITMDEYGLELADVVKLRAACTRRQVGAVIIGPDKRILATGYNGAVAGAVECTAGGCPRGGFSYDQIPGFLGNDGHAVKCVAIHAERNAITFAAKARGREQGRAGPAHHLHGCTLYISCPPCPDCAALAEEYLLRVVHAL